MQIEKKKGLWECGYVNSDGAFEALKSDFETLYAARKYASGIWGDVYHGTNDYIRSYPARPRKFPQEYPNLPKRPDGSSAVELILPHSEGYHIHGKPRLLVKGFLKRWLDEDIQEDREEILDEVIRDFSNFHENSLANQLHETQQFFFRKQDETREQHKRKVLESKQEAIAGNNQSWLFIFAPVVAIVAFSLGRAYQYIF